jgi:NADPH2:quinone reductase
MRAVVVDRPGPAETLHVREYPEPTPGAGEVSIAVHYAGVGFVDTLFRAGVFDLPAPFIPGIEVTGRIRALGSGVTGWDNSQPVAALLNDFGRSTRAGGYAEVAVAHTSMVTALPEDADLAGVAGVLVNWVTAWIALHQMARLQVTDHVLVLGASGGLGSIACRLAALHPAHRVIGVAGSPRRRAAVPTECTDIVLAADLEASVEHLTAGRGIDVVLDPVGGQLRRQAYERLAPFGRLIILGNASGHDPALSGDAAWLGTRQLAGLSLGGVAHLIPDQVTAAATAVIDLLHRGLLGESGPVVLPLERAAEAHQALENRTAPPKTVLAIHAVPKSTHPV